MKKILIIVGALAVVGFGADKYLRDKGDDILNICYQKYGIDDPLNIEPYLKMHNITEEELGHKVNLCLEEEIQKQIN